MLYFRDMTIHTPEHISYRVMDRHMINSQKQKIQQITQKKTTATKSLIQQKVERL